MQQMLTLAAHMELVRIIGACWVSEGWLGWDADAGDARPARVWKMT